MNLSLVRYFALASLLVVTPPGHAQEQTPASRPLRLLMIGNSFAGNAMAYFPKLAEAGGKSVEYFIAAPGGCSLEKHAGFVTSYETDPESPAGKPYISNFYPSRHDPKTRKYSLREALEASPWDYVSIQQLSNLSYKPESFEPYAGLLIAYIHKYAPQAKLLAFQTWAYREDFSGFGKDGFTQEKMYAGLTESYEKLAANYQARIIPVGCAFQAARATERWRFQYPDPDFDYKNPPENTFPREPGSLNIGWTWYRPPDNGKRIFTQDSRHGNDAGKYLAAAVFYEALFGEDVRKVNFVPKSLTPEDAADLRRIAHESYAAYPGSKLIVKAATP